MGKTLLLADDSVTMQKVVGITFANEDIDLVTVDNGDAALERSREVRPDVVLADVGMPGLNGYELCAALKGDPTLQEVRVILLTGTFDTYDEARAREVGADAHVSKPFEAQALVDQVRSLLSSPPVRPAAAASAAGRPAESAPALRRPAPPLPPAESLEPEASLPDLDFESLEFETADADLLSEASPELEAPADDLPAPTGAHGARTSGAPPAVPSRGLPDPNATALVSPSEALGGPDLMPPDAGGEFDDGMQTTLLTPSEAAGDLFGPAGSDLDAPDFDAADFGAADFESSGVLGAPEPERLAPPKPPAPPMRPEPTREAPTAVARPEVGWDLEPPDLGEAELDPTPFDEAETQPPRSLEAASAAEVPEFGSGELPSSAELEMDALASVELEPEASVPGDIEAAGLELEPELGESTEPELAEPLEDEPEDLELTPGEELPWNDAAESEEPETPNFWGNEPPDLGDPLEVPAETLAGSGQPESMSESLREGEPDAPPVRADPGSAAVSDPRSAASAAGARGREVPIDPTAIRQALEKVAWEAFGPLSEQIVREVVKKVEEIAWETLPQIAEQLVQEELARLRSADTDD